MRTLTFFQACFNKKGLCLFYDSAYMGRSTPITAFDRTFWYFAYTIQTHWTYAWRSLVPKKVLVTKWQLWELWYCQACFNKKRLKCLFYDSAYMGWSTPTTAFDGANWHFVYTMLTHWTYAWRSLVHKNLLLTKWHLWELGQFFWIVLNRGYSSICAMIVHTRADQLLSQLLMDSLDTLLSHYTHIANLHEEVWCWKFFFLTKWQLCELRHFSDFY